MGGAGGAWLARVRLRAMRSGRGMRGMGWVWAIACLRPHGYVPLCLRWQLDAVIRSIGATGTRDDLVRFKRAASDPYCMGTVHEATPADVAVSKRVAVAQCDLAIKRGVAVAADWVVERCACVCKRMRLACLYACVDVWLHAMLACRCS